MMDARRGRQATNARFASGFRDSSSFREERAHLRKMQSFALFAKAPIGNSWRQLIKCALRKV
jgi:hypothetical protein